MAGDQDYKRDCLNLANVKSNTPCTIRGPTSSLCAALVWYIAQSRTTFNMWQSYTYIQMGSTCFSSIYNALHYMPMVITVAATRLMFPGLILGQTQHGLTPLTRTRSTHPRYPTRYSNHTLYMGDCPYILIGCMTDTWALVRCATPLTASHTKTQLFYTYDVYSIQSVYKDLYI
jgi:hypothetical protein